MCNWKDAVLFYWFNYWLQLRIATEKNMFSNCCVFSWEHSPLTWDEDVHVRSLICYGSIYVSEVRITSSCIITHPSVLTYSQSGSYWKIYPERIQRWQYKARKNGVAMLANAFTPYAPPVCMSCFLSHTLTHTAMHSVTQMSIVWSDPTAVCHAVYGPASF